MPTTEPPPFPPLTGHCVCKTLTYTLTAPPLITHCCHCTYCQQETGSAFALNTVIETYNFTLTSPTRARIVNRPSPSSPDGSQHLVATCPNPNCNVDVYAFYAGNTATVYVKAGTLDEASRVRVRPDVHIFTRSKVEWVDLRGEEQRGIKVCEGFYDRGDVWTEDSLERLERLSEWKAEQERSGVEA